MQAIQAIVTLLEALGLGVLVHKACRSEVETWLHEKHEKLVDGTSVQHGNLLIKRPKA